MLCSVVDRDVYPGSEFSRDSGSRIQFRIEEFKYLSILTQKIVSKVSEIWSGMFIPDPNVNFLPIPDPRPRVKKAPDPGSRIWIRNSQLYDVELCVHVLIFVLIIFAYQI